MPPLVSIIVPLFNSEPYLLELVASIKGQTYPRWETIFIDDGSTDKTGEMVETIVTEDPRFRFFRKRPEGIPARTRQIGLDHAQGELTALCDHDDLWAPQKLSWQVEAMQCFPKAQIVHTKRIVFENFRSLHEKLPSEARQPHLESMKLQSPEEVLLQGLKITNASFMGRTQSMKRYGYHPDLKGVDEFLLFLQLAQDGQIILIDEPLTYYRWHDSNMSRDQTLMSTNLMKLAELAQNTAIKTKFKKAVMAQALKSKAVMLMPAQPLKALRLLIKSLRYYILRDASLLLILTSLLGLIPNRSIQKKLWLSLRERKHLATNS